MCVWLQAALCLHSRYALDWLACAQNITRDDFDLPTLGPKLVAARDEVWSCMGQKQIADSYDDASL